MMRVGNDQTKGARRREEKDERWCENETAQAHTRRHTPYVIIRKAQK